MVQIDPPKKSWEMVSGNRVYFLPLTARQRSSVKKASQSGAKKLMTRRELLKTRAVSVRFKQVALMSSAVLLGRRGSSLSAPWS